MSFEQPAKNGLALRDSLAAQVAILIRKGLGDEVSVRAERGSTSNADAWIMLARGNERARTADEAMKAGDSAAMLRAVAGADSLFDQASALDAQWAAPFVARGALAYRVSRFYGDEQLRASPWIDKGLADADRALGIAPRDADALSLRGTLRYWRYLLGLEADPVKSKALLQSAREDLESATKISRTQAAAYATLSHLYYQYDDVAGAKLAARSAYEADAYLSNADVVLWRLFGSSYDLEQFPDAIHWCAEGERRFPADARFVKCRLRLMVSPAITPDPARAWRLADSMVALTPAGERPYAKLEAQVFVAGALARAGLKDSTRHLLSRIDDPQDLDPTKDLTLDKGVAYLLLGEKDQAVASLKAYLAANSTEFTDDNNWMWRALRDDPRFQALVKKKSKQ